MKATRNFRLSRTQSVLLPPSLGMARGVIAGEACTELGCDGSVTGEQSWLARWLGLGRKPARTLERNRKWNSAASA